jgi:hypothetical protein
LSRIESEKNELKRLRHSALAKQILALRARAERMAGSFSIERPVVRGFLQSRDVP